MTDIVIISIVTAISSTIAAALGVVSSVMVAKSQKTIRELEKNTNSIKDALVKTTGESEHAKGMLAGALQEQQKEGLKSDNSVK